MSPARLMAGILAAVVMVAATVAAVVEARPAWLILGAAMAAMFWAAS